MPDIPHIVRALSALENHRSSAAPDQRVALSFDLSEEKQVLRSLRANKSLFAGCWPIASQAVVS
jgi:hypothetical protein